MIEGYFSIVGDYISSREIFCLKIAFSGNNLISFSSVTSTSITKEDIYGRLLYTKMEHYGGYYVLLCTDKIFKIDENDKAFLKALPENKEIAAGFKSIRLLREFICL